MSSLDLQGIDRSVIAHTVLGSQIAFLSLSGREALSTLFEFDVELVSTTYLLDMRSLLNTEVTIEIETSAQNQRYLHAVITEFSLLGREAPNSHYYLYRAKLRPALWYLTQGRDSRVFQNKDVKTILKEVFSDYDFSVDFRLYGNYRQWEYCVQYQESDFDFICRLMEHEGMYYFFEHNKGNHTLVIMDDSVAHEVLPSYESYVYFDRQTNVAANREYVHTWHRSAGMTPAKYAVDDYDFRKPQVKLDTSSSQTLPGDRPDAEYYEWLGGYQQIDDGEKYARIRMQELKVNQELINGQSNIRGVAPGFKFSLINHPRLDENQDYLIVSATYRMSVAGYASGSERKDSFETFFEAIPADVQYRAARLTKQPLTSGPQTARVVGPEGQELYTDEYGRIKVQFHWDRQGQNNENSSCWIRVSSPWAGGGFGGLQLPRIGDEVVVDFIGGNPDRPIVLGRVYNRINMPPVELPREANISGFRTQSVFGDSSTENHLLFVDKLGQELIDLRAQMDMMLNVLNNLTSTIGGDRHETVTGNLTTLVTNGNEIREVQKGTRTTMVDGLEKGTFKTGREEYVESGGQFTEISDGETHTVKTGTQKICIEEGNQEITVSGEQVTTVTEKVTNEFNGGFEETITGGEMIQTIVGKTTRDITGDVEDTIKGKVTDSITGDVEKEIDGNLTQTITKETTRTYKGAITDTLEATWDVKAVGKIGFKAPKISMDSTNLWEQIQKVHKFAWYSGSSILTKTDQVGGAHSVFGFKRDNGFAKNGRVFMDDYKNAFGKKDGFMSRVSFIYEAEKEVIKKETGVFKQVKKGLSLII